MKSDFEIISYKFENEIKIIPLADMHIGSPNFDIEKWEETKELLRKDKNIYLIINGDTCDNQTLNSHSPFNINVINGMAMTPMNQKIYITNELKEFKDRILCGCPGNHENRKDNNASNTNIMYEIFCKLDIEDRFRPNMCILKINIGNRNENNRKCYTIACTHGSGGGTQTGSAVNRNEKFSYIFDGLDCLIVSHSHKPVITKPQKIVIDSKNNRVSFKSYLHIISTSYLKYGDYALAKQLTPSSFMLQVLTLTKGKEKNIEVNIK